jgi:hypothetical protein
VRYFGDHPQPLARAGDYFASGNGQREEASGGSLGCRLCRPAGPSPYPDLRAQERRRRRCSADCYRRARRRAYGGIKAASRPLLLTAIFAGLRSSELRGLRWSDVDLKAAMLHVQQCADRYGTIETRRWATPDEMRRFGLKDCPLVHVDQSGEIDCYFTEAGATVVPGASYH